MPNYRRAWVPGGTYFFTAALRDRTARWLVDHADALRTAFSVARLSRPFEVVAAVVLPEHLHCVWRLPDGDADHATRWRHIKTLFAQALRATDSQVRKPWQPRHWEHLIRNERDLRQHIDYIHFNPVKHGHVRRASEWPHSSIHRYIRAAVIAPDWGDASSDGSGDIKGGQ